MSDIHVHVCTVIMMRNGMYIMVVVGDGLDEWIA